MTSNKVRLRLCQIIVWSVLFFVLAACQPIQPAPNVEKLSAEVTTTVVENQIIVLGTRESLPSMMEALRQGEPSIRPVEGVKELALSDLISREFELNPENSLEQLVAALRVSQVDINALKDLQLTAQLFEWRDEKYTVDQALERVNFLRKEQTGILDENYLVAQPNYWLTPSAQSKVALCHGIGAAPHPSTIIPTDFGDPIADADISNFDQQLAFKQLTENDNWSFDKGTGGAGVRIIIFDTSPFANPQDGESFAPVKIDSVIYPQTVTNPMGGPFAKRQHGLFVASLARAVAPKSTIQLIRVLDEDTCGTLIGLDLAFGDLLADSPSDEKLVINMSLVYRREKVEVWEDFLTSVLMSITSWRPNTIVVAAAGNEWNGQGHSQPPALYPAAYAKAVHNVLAVESTNVMGTSPSCFSNDGGVRAPGGQGKSNTCDPSAPTDSLSDIEMNNIVGATYGYGKTNYAWWSGTSFATPLVSGVAARCLGNGDSAVETMKKFTDPSDPAFRDPVTVGICP